MLTDKQMLEIANQFIAFKEKRTNIEVQIYQDNIIKKEYGNIYYFESKKYLETGIFSYKLLGNSPFLVEKKTGRIVNFGTANQLDYYLEAYENNSLVPCMDRYWDPKTETYSS